MVRKISFLEETCYYVTINHEVVKVVANASLREKVVTQAMLNNGKNLPSLTKESVKIKSQSPQITATKTPP